MALDARQRAALLALAREAIGRGLAEPRMPRLPAAMPAAGLEIERSSFVTLTIDGQLRGCCGTLEPRGPLWQDVWRNAWVSAFEDSRFAPLAAEEFSQLTLAISVLSPLEPHPAASERALLASLRPGIDGLVLELGETRATFLPAVWEMLPEPPRFLEALKEKAGLPAGLWSPRLRFERYTTESFGEDEAPPAP
jgi:AmmeMemoRadiSam system protein A